MHALCIEVQWYSTVTTFVILNHWYVKIPHVNDSMSPKMSSWMSPNLRPVWRWTTVWRWITERQRFKRGKSCARISNMRRHIKNFRSYIGLPPIVSRPQRASRGHGLDTRFNGLVGSYLWAGPCLDFPCFFFLFCWASAHCTPHQFKALQLSNGYMTIRTFLNKVVLLTSK